MKKFLSVFCLLLIITVSFCSCSKIVKTDEIYKIGQKASTDLAEFTLENGSFAIALTNTIAENYLMPKEYDASADQKNPYVASKGHTFVAITFTLSNLDRTSLDLQNFIDCEYTNAKGKKEKASLEVKGECTNGWDWKSYNSSNILLTTGESNVSYRAYVELETEIKDLKSSFNVIVDLPNSDGKTHRFVYEVTEEGRKAYKGREVTFEQALAGFKNAPAREYFTKHQKEYENVKGDTLGKLLKSKRWTVVYIALSKDGKAIGHWSGHFNFLGENSGGKIKDDYGFVNERTWKVKGNKLILNGKYECTVKRLADRQGYLLVCDGEAYGLLK